MQPGRLAVVLEGSEAFTSSIENARSFCRNSKSEASKLRCLKTGACTSCQCGSQGPERSVVFLSDGAGRVSQIIGAGLWVSDNAEGLDIPALTATARRQGDGSHASSLALVRVAVM